MIDKPLLGEDTYLDPLFADGLVGCWLFNENPDKLGTVYDVSGYDNHGTLVADCHGVPGLFGPALLFDGTGDYVDIGNAEMVNFGTGDFTLTAWIYLNTISAYQTILAKDYYNDDFQWRIDDGGKHRLYVGDDSVTSHITLSTNTWYFLTAIRRQTIGAVYLNGVLDCAPESMTASIDNVHPLYIGIRRDAVHPFNGRIDYVMVWNRALTVSEIALLYQEPFWGFKKRESGIYTRI